MKCNFVSEEEFKRIILLGGDEAYVNKAETKAVIIKNYGYMYRIVFMVKNENKWINSESYMDNIKNPKVF